MADDQPTRRIVLLGASNLVRSFSTVVETARLTWQEPLDVMAAIGHGRSYGQDSSILGRKISGIFPALLWGELQRRPALPTAALMTDLGNDVALGVPVERIVAWIAGCLDRLQQLGAATIVTQLPMDSLNRLGPRRYRLFRDVMFPSCRLSLSQVQTLAQRLNDEVVRLAEARNIAAIPAPGAWYGFDPIHLKRSVWHVAWPQILAAWRDRSLRPIVPRGSLARWAYLRCLAPAEREVFGWRRQVRQPCGMLNDGTTISLY